MQTSYGARPYQTPTSRNCKLFRTRLCLLLLAARDTNIQGLQGKTSVLPMGTHLKLHANYLTNDSNTNLLFLHYLNAHLNPRIN